MATTASGWDKNAAHYEAIVGRLAWPLARGIVSRVGSLASFESPDARVFDNGCGTGIVARTIRECYPYVPIMATDVSAGMVAELQRKIEDDGLENITAQVEDATTLAGLPDDSFTHTLALAMIGSTPDPQKVMNEMFRVTKPGGVLGLGSWVGHCWKNLIEPTVHRALGTPEFEAPVMVDPSTGSVDAIRSLLVHAGWNIIEIKQQKAPFLWKDKQELLDFFFDREHPNPIGGRMLHGLEDEIDRLRPVMDQVIEETWPNPADMYETAILAFARKKA